MLPKSRLVSLWQLLNSRNCTLERVVILSTPLVSMFAESKAVGTCSTKINPTKINPNMSQEFATELMGQLIIFAILVILGLFFAMAALVTWIQKVVQRYVALKEGGRAALIFFGRNLAEKRFTERVGPVQMVASPN